MMALLNWPRYLQRVWLTGLFAVLLGGASAAWADNICTWLFTSPERLAAQNDLRALAIDYLQQVEQLRAIPPAERDAAVRARQQVYYQTFLQELQRRIPGLKLLRPGQETTAQTPWKISLVGRPPDGTQVSALKLSLSAAIYKHPELWNGIYYEDGLDGQQSYVLSLAILIKRLMLFWKEVGMSDEVNLDLYFYDARLGQSASGAIREETSFNLPLDPQQNHAFITVPLSFFTNYFDSGLRLIHELHHYKQLPLRPTILSGEKGRAIVAPTAPDALSLDEAEAYFDQLAAWQKMVQGYGGLDADWGELENQKISFIQHLRDWQAVVPLIIRDLRANLKAVEQALADGSVTFKQEFQQIGPMVQKIARTAETARLKLTFSYTRPEANGQKTPLVWEQYIYNPLAFMREVQESTGVNDYQSPVFAKALQENLWREVAAAIVKGKQAVEALAQMHEKSLRDYPNH